jgi:hypothetical protein
MRPLDDVVADGLDVETGSKEGVEGVEEFEVEIDEDGGEVVVEDYA